MPLISAIPEKYIGGFEKLSSLTNEDFEKIKEGISYTSLTFSLKKLADNIVEVKKVNPADLHQIFVSLGSILPYMEKVEAINELIDDIANIGVQKGFIKDKNTFVERLTFLFSSPQIYYASKARELLTECGNIYIDSRLITDIRPVFGIDLDESPKGAMIIHNLHIHYQADEEGDHKDLFLALDAKDIKTLKDVLNRAEIKEKSLKTVIEKAGLTNLKD